MREGLEKLETDIADVEPDARLSLRFGNNAGVADLLGDFQKAAESNKALASGPAFENWNQLAPLAQAYELARQHDAAGSLAVLSNHQYPDSGSLEFLSAMGDELVPAYERAIVLDDWSAAAADMRETIAAAPHWPTFAPIALPLFLQPRLAYALARGSQQAEADNIAATLPKTCYRWARTRGWVATMAHDWPRTDHEFAEAVRQGPSLPGAYSDWGASLLERGDPSGAIEKFSAAHNRGPHFDDPLELCGARRCCARATTRLRLQNSKRPRSSRRMGATCT